MKTKIVGILVCMLLITTVFPAMGMTMENKGKTIDKVVNEHHCDEIILDTYNKNGDDLDQYQYEYKTDNSHLFGYSIYQSQWLAQSFKPTMNTLTRVKLWMWRLEGVDFPIKISIRDDLQNGEDLGVVEKNANEILTQHSWIEFDFDPNISVVPDKTYYIVAICNDGDSDHTYAWVYGENTAYTRGSGWSSLDKGISWANDVLVDQCFEMWGSKVENLPPNKPSAAYDSENDELIITATDPDGDQIQYGVSWDNDYTVDQRTDLVDSGTEQRIDCEERKFTTVGVIAIDEHGAESDWVSQKSKNKAINTMPLFQRILENHPHMFPILRQLLGL